MAVADERAIASKAEAGRRHAVVTGTAGLGLETARELARAGCSVILAGRNANAGGAAVAAIRAEVAGADVRFEHLDLADLSSIAGFADRLADAGRPIDILVNNAGIMSPPRRVTTVDGFEVQFGVNYLGHFALTARLMPLLLQGDRARVVNVTSLAQRQGRIDFDDLQSETRYRAGRAYCQSKLAQAVFALELDRRARRAGLPLISNAAHPGFAGTGLFANGSGPKSAIAVLSKAVFVPLIGQSAAAGAQPTLFAATSPDAVGGTLSGPKGRFEMRGPPGLCAFAPRALDEALATRLWAVSEDLVGLPFKVEP